MSSRSLRRPRLRAAPADLLEHRCLHGRHRGPELGVADHPARARARPAGPGGAGCSASPSARRSSSRRRCSVVALDGAEDDAHDHLQRDRLHARPQLERLAHRPALRPPAARPRPSSRRSAPCCLPWNEGSISLRRVMCSGSSSSITERGPSRGPSSVFASPTPSSAGSAVKTRLTSSGSHSSTHVPPWRMRSVKMSP